MHPIERLRWLARSDDEPAAALAVEAAWTLAELVEVDPAAALTAARRLTERHPANGPMYWACSRLLGAADPTMEANSISKDLCSDAAPGELAKAIGSSFPSGATLVTAPPTDLVRALSGPDGLQLRLVAELADLRHLMRELAVAGDVAGFLPDEISDALEGASVVAVEALAAGPDSVLLSPTAAHVVRTAAGAAGATGATGAPATPATMPLWLIVGAGRVLPSVLIATAVSTSRRTGVASVVPLGLFHSAITPAGPSDVTSALRSSGCPATDWLTR